VDRLDRDVALFDSVPSIDQSISQGRNQEKRMEECMERCPRFMID